MTLRHKRLVLYAGALVVLAALLGPVPHSARQMVWDFEADQPGLIAVGFASESGRWEVALEGENRVLAQRAENRAEIFNVALLDDTSYRDVDVSVRMKAVAGENEGGGGLLWRAKDKDNYYVSRYNPFVARHNPRRPSFRLYKVENGRCTQLDHADAPGETPGKTRSEAPTATEWHTLRITMIGREIIGYLDGQKLLEADDATFLDVGRIGLWTKSDARSYFDDLTVSGP